ncbi:MAG: PQQ-binding-like beta-propeller repeat protein [Planctomycetia bacterium]|nr:PQQ-binding-like beta-propeller repeat protein [Planctomycetia bacterium]
MRSRHPALCLCLLLACVTFAIEPTAGAADWTRFRGPNGTGVAADKNVPVQWNDQNILWKVVLPGGGNSSPIIYGDKLFIQSADAKSRMLLCIDVKDGKIIWNKSVPGGTAKTHAKSSLASSTPATDGERVYCYFWDGKDVSVSAFDFKGNPVWHRVLGAFESQHGAGASPMLVDGKVIVNNDQDGKSELIALDAKTGQPAWQVPRPPFRACYSTPFVLEKNGKTELIVVSTAGVTSYNPKTGGQNWNWEWKFDGMALRTVGSAVAANGIIFAGSGDGSGARHMVAVRDDGKGLVWQEKKVMPYVPCMLTQGEHLYYVNDRGIAGCLDGKTGKEVWSQRLPGTGVFASPVLIDGKIYASSEDGSVTVYEAAPAFKQLAKNSIPEPILASPAVANDRLYIRGKTTLYCIGKK